VVTADDQPTDFPLQVPARMLNEFTYCPRLFYLEWVQGQFVGNADTAEGTWQHRAVDVEKGRAPIADEVEDLREARSLRVGSERLGLIAVIDVLEGLGKEVRPLDVKKGRPPDNDHRAYEPERVQLCAAALILRDNGYICNEGVLYFATTKERVTVVFDDDLVIRTLELLLELHATARSEDIPRRWLIRRNVHGARWSASACLTRSTNCLFDQNAHRAVWFPLTMRPGRCM
jgi:CRISP-associated protein Cas1